MARAVFEVVADASSVVSVLSSLPPLARRVATAMRTAFRQTFDSTAKGAEEMRNSVAKSYLEAGLAARKYVDESQKAEKARTAAAKSEGNYRKNARRTEADEAIREEERVTRASQREANRRTAAAQRAARERVRLAGQWAERGFNAAASFGSTAHGMIQGARQMNASPERLIGSAVYQAGGDRAERDARMAQARAISMRTGLSMADIGEAMSRSQSEFNALAGDTPAQRGEAFARFSRTMDFAARTNTSASEAARLQGMLTQTGFGSGMQDTLMRFAAGAAQSGSVEVGDLTRTALTSIMRRMGDATAPLGRDATVAQREAAMAAAFRQQVAALQVFRAGGDTPRAAGNALASAQNFLRDPTRQDKLLTNIRAARDRSADPAARARYTALISTLFERDPTRTGNAQRVRASYQDPMALQAELFRATNGDATASANILAGGGSRGNAQSFLANQRALFGALGRTDAQGVTGADRVRNLMRATISNEDLARGADIFTTDTQANLNREETQRVAALTNNSRALVQLSNELAKFSAANPLASAAAGGVGMSIAGGALARAPGLAMSAGTAAAAAGGGGLAGAATTAAGAAVAGFAGAVVGDLINTHLVSPLMDRDRTELQRQQNARTSEDFSIFRNGFSLLASEIRDAFGGGVVARVAPQDAQHAATQAAAGRPANTSR